MPKPGPARAGRTAAVCTCVNVKGIKTCLTSMIFGAKHFFHNRLSPLANINSRTISRPFLNWKMFNMERGLNFSKFKLERSLILPFYQKTETWRLKLKKNKKRGRHLMIWFFSGLMFSTCTLDV
jgi:hypothetical protein